MLLENNGDIEQLQCLDLNAAPGCGLHGYIICVTFLPPKQFLKIKYFRVIYVLYVYEHVGAKSNLKHEPYVQLSNRLQKHINFSFLLLLTAKTRQSLTSAK